MKFIGPERRFKSLIKQASKWRWKAHASHKLVGMFGNDELFVRHDMFIAWKDKEHLEELGVMRVSFEHPYGIQPLQYVVAYSEPFRDMHGWSRGDIINEQGLITYLERTQRQHIEELSQPPGSHWEELYNTIATRLQPEKQDVIRNYEWLKVKASMNIPI